MELPAIKRHLICCNCPSCQFFRAFINDDSPVCDPLPHTSLEHCARHRMRMNAEDGPPISSSLGIELAMRHALTGS